MPDISDRLIQATGSLTTAATRLMEEGLPWYRELGAQERTSVAQVAHAGITAFITWYRQPGRRRVLIDNVFGAAPRELTRVISLEQTVALVRTTIAVVESAIDELAEPADRPALREAVLTYSREIAFAAAEVYARAAEARGAWDARLEAYIVDALLRGDLDTAVLGRASALGWTGADAMAVVAGIAPAGDPEAALDAMRRTAHNAGLDLLTGVHGATVLAVVGKVNDAGRAARLLSAHLADGPVVYSEVVSTLHRLPEAARDTLSGMRAIAAWPLAPRPVATEDLLPERALAGDPGATGRLVQTVLHPLAADPPLLATVTAYLEQSPSLEATARALFVHPNTVRYRLRRVAEVTGYTPHEPRGAFALGLALRLGRLTAPDT